MKLYFFLSCSFESHRNLQKKGLSYSSLATDLFKKYINKELFSEYSGPPKAWTPTHRDASRLNETLEKSFLHRFISLQFIPQPCREPASLYAPEHGRIPWVCVCVCACVCVCVCSCAPFHYAPPSHHIS